jgi:16S rRNA (adenine1518-N6/adenine1519-N6)-dimethyltransferase
MKRAKDQLKVLGVKPAKGRGQNFLLDQGVIETILDLGRLEESDAIVEIGPGLGALTARLSDYKDVTAIEIEDKFCEQLRIAHPAVKIVNDDVRFVDLDKLGEQMVVFGNLPYSFSTDIIFHLIKFRRSIKRAVLMLQKEFADRLAAGPGGREYGVISVTAKLYATVSPGPLVPGSSFHPPTKVTSRIIVLEFPEPAPYKVEDHEWIKKVVKASFYKRRKKIINSLKASGLFSAMELESALEKAGIDPGRRAETLSIDEFLTLSTLLKRAGGE